MRLMSAATLVAGLIGLPAMAESIPPVLPEIILTHSDGMIHIEGVVSAIGPAEVTATLTISHKGSSGTMNTQQSRNLTLAALDKRVSVASTGLNFGVESHLVVDLSVMRGDVVIAGSKVEIGVAPSHQNP